MRKKHLNAVIVIRVLGFCRPMNILVEVGCRGYFLGHALEFKYTPVFLKDFGVRKPKKKYIYIYIKIQTASVAQRQKNPNFAKKLQFIL